MLRAACHRLRLLPAGARAMVVDARLARAHPGGRVRIGGYSVRILDPENARVMARDIFGNRIYQFHPVRPDPFVLDCGSNIGLSILFAKRLCPGARIVGFEPDPEVFGVLEENVAANNLTDVELVRAAVSAREGTDRFGGEHDYDGALSAYAGAVAPKHEVATVRLRDRLDTSVDFLKLNVEGAEWEALHDCGDRLENVRELVVEYHHEPELPRTLHSILELLHEAGFEYLVHDFDRRTSPGSHPPFTLRPESRYYALVYAARVA